MAGRPPFQPTDAMRELVADLAAACLPHDDIGQALRSVNGGAPLDPKTLRKHFRDELDHGAAMTRVRAQRRLFQLIDDGNLGAICFFLKCRAGWKESVRVENTGADGAPLPGPTFAATLYLPSKEQLKPLADVSIGSLAAELRLPTTDAEPRPRSSPHEPPRAVRHEPPEPEPPRRVAGAVSRYMYPDPRT